MPQQGSQAPGPLAMLFPFVMMIAIFYILVFRPQAKIRKEHETMLKNLKKNDEVVTSGGILGTVVNVKSETVTLRIDDNVRVEVERAAIVRLVKLKGQGSEPVTMEKKS